MKDKLAKILLPITFAGAVVFYSYYIGLAYSLQCERKYRGGPVNCFEQASWFSIALRSKREIRDVRGAEVFRAIIDPDDTTLFIRLVTGEGNVELDYGYSYDNPAVEKRRDLINDFVSGQTGGAAASFEPAPRTFWDWMDLWPAIPIFFFAAAIIYVGFLKVWAKIMRLNDPVE